MLRPEKKNTPDLTHRYSKEYLKEENWFQRTKECIDFLREKHSDPKLFIKECLENNIKISDTEGFLKIWWHKYKEPLKILYPKSVITIEEYKEESRGNDDTNKNI